MHFSLQLRVSGQFKDRRRGERAHVSQTFSRRIGLNTRSHPDSKLKADMLRTSIGLWRGRRDWTNGQRFFRLFPFLWVGLVGFISLSASHCSLWRREGESQLSQGKSGQCCRSMLLPFGNEVRRGRRSLDPNCRHLGPCCSGQVAFDYFGCSVHAQNIPPHLPARERLCFFSQHNSQVC